MLQDKPLVDIDISGFVKSAKKHIGQDWPRAIVGAFAEMANDGAMAARALTRGKFKLHSDYITRGIKSIPKSQGQLKASERALKRHGDFTAAVYLRGAASPKRSLSFMADHETGMDRVAQDTWIAMPTTTLKRKSFKTARGKVRKRWKPGTLLKRFNEVGSTFNGSTTTNKGKHLDSSRKRSPGSSFIIAGRGGTPMIARRASGKGNKRLEFLYALNKKANIRKGWDFVNTVTTIVEYIHERTIKKAVGKMPNYDRV